MRGIQNQNTLHRRGANEKGLFVLCRQNLPDLYSID